MSSRYSPNTPRSVPAISPTVAWDSTAVMMGGTRLVSPRAASPSASSARTVTVSSRDARTAATRAR